MITAGEILKKKRESLGRSLDVTSKETRIQKRFLMYIESNDFEKFDSEIFVTGFIKIYSQYLGLDVTKVLALYRRSRPQPLKSKVKNKKELHIKTNFFTPKNLVTLLSIIFLIGIMGYIGYQIYKFQSPPKLLITAPLDETVTDQSTLTVEGSTNPEVIVEINGSLTDVAEDGKFQKDITLQEGINIITIKAKKNSNNVLETVETRKVTYNKPEETEQNTINTNKTFTLKVQVKDSSAWVKLDIDNENKLEQVVQPSTQEYTVTQKFYIITGKVNNTFIYMNDEPLTWKTNTTTGVAQITCSIVDQNLACE